MFCSIVEAIFYYASKTPDVLCVADAKTEYTYFDFYKAIKSAAKLLKLKGVEKGVRVIVECTQNTDYCIWQQAIALAGAVFVPVEKKTSNDRLKEIIEEVGATLFIGLSSREVAIPLVDITEIPDDKTVDVEEWRFPLAEQWSEILFSSGTTGKPKGIVLSHGNNVAIAENVRYGVNMKDGNVELIPVALSHSHGLRTIYANFIAGNSVVIVNGVTFMKPFFQMVKKYSVTAFDLVPSAWRLMYKMAAEELRGLSHQIDYVQLGSAPLTEEDKQTLKSVFTSSRLYNFYGSTESGRTCTYDFAAVADRKNCIGKPAYNASVIVMDENKQELAYSSRENPGLLAFVGKMNMVGYWDKESQTTVCEEHAAIYSKDRGFIDEDGWVYTLGREDDLINFGGVKISPEEIETITLTHCSVDDCACVGMNDSVSGEVPCLFIKRKSGSALTLVELKAYLRNGVEPEKMPKYIYEVDSIPRTFNGKILRRVLKNIDGKELKYLQ